MNKNGKNNIEISDIVDLSYDCKRLFLNNKSGKYNDFPNQLQDPLWPNRVTLNVENHENLGLIKYELIKRAKANPDPYKRVCKFEWFPDFNKKYRLTNSRKRAQEINNEKTELIESIKVYEENNIDCQFLKDELKKMLKGGF